MFSAFHELLLIAFYCKFNNYIIGKFDYIAQSRFVQKF